MADTQPTPAEPETAKLAGLNVSADSKTANGTKLSATASSFAPGKFSSAGDEESVSSGKSEDKKEELLRVFSMMWFMRPSKIQNEALPLLLKNPPNTVVGQLPSGTGKTAAFILNILQRVDLASNKRQAIFAAPFDNGSSLLVSKAQHRQASASSLP